jgi:glycosyltransferase involved in cell wall biosynthesis
MSTARSGPGTGEHTRALWVSSSLSAYGGIATFVNTMRDTPLWEEWHVRHIATHCDGTRLTRLAVFVSGFVRFVLELTLRRPDVVHIHTSERGSFIRKGLLVWISTQFQVPTLLHMHGGAFHEYLDGSAPPVQRFIRATLQRADVVIALGKTWAQRLRDAAPDAHIEIVPNAIRPNPAVDQAAADEVQVVFLGRLCDRKGTTVLIDAWAEMLAAGNTAPAELTIAGWDEIERARTQVAALGLGDSVHIVGWLSPVEAQQALAASHVLVLPSINEGQPMAILEAMSRGVCVVSTTAGGIPEMIGEADGILVTPGSVTELAQALATVINSPDIRRRFGTHARERVEQHFNVEVISRQIGDLYREQLAQGL